MLPTVIAARQVPTVLVVVAVAVGLVACGSSSAGNGLASKPPATIVRATTKASESARSVHVSGSLTQAGTVIALDLRMVAGVGATGWMSDAGKRFSLVLDRSTLYIKGGASFWRAFGNATVAKLLRGKWLKAPASGDYASIAKFANLREFFQQIFSATTGRLSKAETKTINGQPAVGVRDTERGGVLYVAARGKPYPLEIDGTTAGGAGTTGKLDFTAFNAPVTISPPRHTISVAELQKLG
jgi:hypothetical protein